MELILLAILFFILYPVFKFFFNIRRQVKNINQQFQDAQRRYSGGGGTYQDNNYQRQQQKKRYSDVSSQYVDFEEIIEERKSEPPVEPSIPYEPQISDAEFEEIKTN